MQWSSLSLSPLCRPTLHLCCLCSRLRSLLLLDDLSPRVVRVLHDQQSAHPSRHLEIPAVHAIPMWDPCRQQNTHQMTYGAFVLSPCPMGMREHSGS